MENQVAVRENGLPTEYRPEQAEVIRTDIKIAYLAIAQAVSDIVKEGKAEIGDIYRTSTWEVLGGPEKGVDAIFLHYPINIWTYQLKDKGATKFRFHHTEPRTAKNDSLPWYFFADDEGVEMKEGEKGALEWRRVKTLKVFALLSADIEAAQIEMVKLDLGELPDPNKALVPVCLNFSVSSYDAGKEICTFHSRASSMNVPIWKYALTLSNYLEHKDDNSFYVWQANTKIAKGVPKEALPLVQKWAELIGQNAQTIKTDDEAQVIDVQ